MRIDKPKKSDVEVVQTFDDVEMVKRPHLWPGVVLPMKLTRERGGWDVGYVMDVLSDGRVQFVRGRTIFEPFPGPDAVETIESAEKLIEEGWRVD